MRHRLPLVFALLAALSVAGSAYPIVGGAIDTSHTYVGAVIQSQVRDGQAGYERCTGFLIGPTHFVTAAHCFDPSGGPILVTFDQHLSTPSSPSPSSFVPATISATLGDIAVLTLQTPQQAWASLPSGESSVSTVDVVGYGVEGLDPKKNPTGFGTRSIVTTPVKSAGNLNDQSLKLLSDPGACFGDSGGPNFISGTSIVVAITSSGSKNCNGVSFATRIDTPGVLAFLTPFANS